MSIGEMQACLGRLYVDESFRKLFFIDPSAALEGYRLSKDESIALRNLDHGELEIFANSLIGKRRKRVERAYPLLFALDAAEIRCYYSRFFQLYTAKPNQAGLQDIVDFGTFMEESLMQAEQLPPYASDLAKYERLYQWASLSGTFSGDFDNGGHEEETASSVISMDSMPRLSADVMVADFAYDVGEIEEALQQGHPVNEASLSSGGCSIIFRPGTNTTGVQMLRMNAPTKYVLQLCDGSHTVSQIVTDTERALHASNLNDNIIVTINRLLALQVLVFNTGGDVPATSKYRDFVGAMQVESI